MRTRGSRKNKCHMFFAVIFCGMLNADVIDGSPPVSGVIYWSGTAHTDALARALGVTNPTSRPSCSASETHGNFTSILPAILRIRPRSSVNFAEKERRFCGTQLISVNFPPCCFLTPIHGLVCVRALCFRGFRPGERRRGQREHLRRHPRHGGFRNGKR